MKKGQILEGFVERVDFPNKGLVRCKEENGEEAFCLVKNVLPGQRISFRVQKKRNGRAQGQLLEILEKAENEVESPCPHFGLCGGCLYQNLSYEDQCALKKEQVKRLLDSVLCKQDGWKFEELKPSPAIYGYRNKMEFTFGDEVKDGPLSVGLHKQGGFYDILTVSGCMIMDQDYRKILTAAGEYFEKTGLPFFHRLRHTGFLRHLLVRKGAKTGEILVALVTTGAIDSVAGKAALAKPGETSFGESAADLAVNEESVREGEAALKTEKAESGENTAVLKVEKDVSKSINGFSEMLLGLSLDGKIVGILHMRNDSVADVVKSDETRILYGRDYYYEELLGLRFRISAFSFFQTNSLGAEVLYSTAREFIGNPGGGEEAERTERTKTAKRDKVVFDLYSGTGTIAQLIAPMAKKVVGVEIVEEAVAAAKENAALNGLTNCEFIAGDVLKVLDELEEKPDVIILDPPRDGVHPKALQKILAYGVERIVYISCKPTSLARDLESFLEAGYRAERIVCCDQFPWTGNVETCVLLSRRNQVANPPHMTSDKHKKYVIRSLRKGETDLLKDFLYEAIFIPKGAEPPARDIIEKPELRVYTEDFGTRKGDNCLVADFGGKVVGAVWTRIMNDYGHVDDETPSFAISLYKEYRSQGIGSQLMVKMIELLKWQGYERASLAVQKANYAVKMYKDVGFKTVDENAEEYIMVCKL